MIKRDYSGLNSWENKEAFKKERSLFTKALARDGSAPLLLQGAVRAQDMLNPMHRFIANNTVIDAYDSLNKAHPIATPMSQLVPVLGAIPSGLSGYSNLRKGRYGSASADFAFAVMQTLGLGSAAKLVSNAGKTSLGVQGLRSTHRTMSNPGLVKRIVYKAFGKGVPLRTQSKVVSLMAKAPGMHNIKPDTVQRISNLSHALNTPEAGSLATKAIPVAILGSFLDPMHKVKPTLKTVSTRTGRSDLVKTQINNAIK